MRLELFNKIDATCDILKNNKELYDGLRKEIKFSLLDALKDTGYVLSIASIIKTSDSLKEKLIRNRFYLKYDTPEEIFDNLNDLIGLKIECRFMDEEHKVFDSLKTIFTNEKEENPGYFNAIKYPNIYLKLGDKQPQHQRNGYSIYRIDGFYLFNKEEIRFELQIKCMVNSFWGDIEHKLVYKNTNYYVFDDFMKNLLGSVKSNLTIIDQQLHIIYNEMNTGTKNLKSFEDRLSIDILISKSINDIFTEKLKKDVGFTINLKETSNILAYYIMHKDLTSIEEEDDHLFALLTLFKQIDKKEISFNDAIIFENHFDSTDIFVKTVGDFLIEQINLDFSWHVFFKILFSIEPGNNLEDFKLFLKVYRKYFIDKETFENSFAKLKNGEDKKVQNELLKMLANTLISNGTIKIIENKRIESIKKCFADYVELLESRVIDYKDFMHFAGVYYEKLSEQINDILN